jgi:uncharacterized protein YecA (UPF0149 family)
MSYELGVSVTPDCLVETKEAPKPVPPPKKPVPRINGIKWGEIPPHVREKLVMKTSRKFLTRNSACPCSSGKRYKRCCGKGTGV